MNDQKRNDPALAFAIYASSAATMAISALRAANIVNKEVIDQLVENLTRCRLHAGDDPVLIEHAELLTDLLLAVDSQK